MKWSSHFDMISTSDLLTVASTLDSAWNTFWTDATNGLGKFLFTDVTTVETIVYQKNASWRTTSVKPTPRALAGTNANITGNIASSPYMSFTGANDTKSDRGHFHFPPFASNQISAGLILNATCDSIGISFSTFMASMLGLAGSQIISFNTRTNKLGEPPFTNHVLTGGTMGNRPGTARMRDRKLKATHFATITF
jgi:hypothetical protein